MAEITIKRACLTCGRTVSFEIIDEVLWLRSKVCLHCGQRVRLMLKGREELPGELSDALCDPLVMESALDKVNSDN